MGDPPIEIEETLEKCVFLESTEESKHRKSKSASLGISWNQEKKIKKYNKRSGLGIKFSLTKT
jgi:hypothetical protein